MGRTQLLAATALGSSIGFLVPGAARALEPAYDWSGFYAGIGIGWAQSGADVQFSRISGTADIPASVQVPALGFDGSVKLGRNWQSGQFVYGIEADGSLLSLNGYASGSTYTVRDSLNALLSLRARFGVTFDQVLIYGDAGVAAGRSSFRADVSDTSDGSPATASGTVVGTVVGVGVEFGLTEKLSLSLGVDRYALASLHGQGVTDSGYLISQTTYDAAYTPRGLIFQTGLNARF